MVDRLRYFPTTLILCILLFFSLCVNAVLINRLENIQQNTCSWMSEDEYQQIVNEIERLEKENLDLK